MVPIPGACEHAQAPRRARSRRPLSSMSAAVASPALRPRVRHPRQILRLPDRHRPAPSWPTLCPGGSTGEVRGGSFTNGGWLVNAPGNFIRYEVPPMARGWVEFDTSGLRPENPAHNQFMLFGMWDPTAGPFRSNPFRVNIQKLHPNPHNPPYLRVRWIANGEQRDDGTNFFDWNPSRTYRWRLEWGPDGSFEQGPPVSRRRIDHRDCL